MSKAKKIYDMSDYKLMKEAEYFDDVIKSLRSVINEFRGWSEAKSIDEVEEAVINIMVELGWLEDELEDFDLLFNRGDYDPDREPLNEEEVI